MPRALERHVNHASWARSLTRPIGARYLTVSQSTVGRSCPSGLPDRETEHFTQLCDPTAPLGRTLDLEFPSWTETPNLAEATAVPRAADRPNAGMLIDLLHIARSQSSIEELRALPREWFHVAHVCDAPAHIPSTVERPIHTARYERLFPGEGGNTSKRPEPVPGCTDDLRNSRPGHTMDLDAPGALPTVVNPDDGNE